MLILDIAVKKIFKLKKRPMNNPLIVHYYDINKLKQDCILMIILLNFIKNFPWTYNIYS